MNTQLIDTGPGLNDTLAQDLLANLAAFHAFARKRLHDDHLAADAVQESLLRAIKAEPSLANNDHLVAWFYRILRNVLIDLYRRRTRRERAMQEFAAELDSNAAAAEINDAACRCFHGLLPTLRPDYARVLQLADLDGNSAESVAAEIGITKANLKVRLHRARKQLRQRLELTCQACASHGCLDCTCDPQA